MTALAFPGSCVEYLTCEVKLWLVGVVSVIGYKSITVISLMDVKILVCCCVEIVLDFEFSGPSFYE